VPKDVNEWDIPDDFNPRENRRGRPAKIVFDLDKIEAWAQVGCSYNEMAALMGCSHVYFNSQRKAREEVQDAIDRGRANMHKSLRVKQLDVALNEGSVPMLIHLGKSELGQTDRMEFNQNISGDLIIDTEFRKTEEPKESNSEAS
jgi:hypothetical protein